MTASAQEPCREGFTAEGAERANQQAGERTEGAENAREEMDEHEHATGNEGTPGYRLERPGGMGGSDAVRVGVGWRAEMGHC